MKKGAWKPEHPDRYVIYQFDAPDDVAANAMLAKMKREGFPEPEQAQPETPSMPAAPPPKLWRFRGAPHYLDQQGPRVNSPPVEMHKARTCRELHAPATIIGQLCDRYHSLRKGEHGIPVIDHLTSQQFYASLATIEVAVAKLHGIAAASAQMSDETHIALGFPVPNRGFSVTSAYDTPQPAHEAKAS